MTRRILMSLLTALLCCGMANGQLLIDFNSTNQDGGPHNDTAGGFSAYDAGHEVAADFVTQSYPAFGSNVSVTPTWPNTDDNRVMQSIDRGNQSTDPVSSFDANWTDPASSDLDASPVPILGLDLVTDFLGTDTRTGNGGNGDYDGTTGTPTLLNITLGGLPANTYTWQSAHIDTEHVHLDFEVRVSTDGGTTFADTQFGRMVDAADGGNPNSVDSGFLDANVTDSLGAALNGAIFSTDFTTDGSSDVVLQFAPHSQDAVHRQIFGINGFVLTEAVPEPGSMLLSLFAAAGLVGFVRRRR